ncbi:alpha/beta fold hydrolase [Novosphingobium sp. Fuku2-ISO-50]|uniref:alpha/beta fold hydrolase n=1 Tax=Novosphingobium sp. Fuku2-ISO-50 TaxID=1739114 RepID=UPI00076D5257|nr:alpha/beta hydrolase [Novosphingobium sp. Fuku2-ISO-50]KUR78748.1 alpha/beta hydrolase [Novosphingobium sp. Fuku2-ISO-50]
MKRLALTAFALAAIPAPNSAIAEPSSVPAPPAHFQAQFDTLGPVVQALPGPKGRTVHFADTGEAGWRPVLFLGGTGTSARAFLMTGYLETLRRQLHLRFISVERNGFGDTAYDPAWGYDDYVGEVRAVLDHLGVARFAMVAISGGGPYAGHIAAAMPDRLISLHFAAALANVRSAGLDTCQAPLADAAKGLAGTVQNPQKWWSYPPSSPTHRIPGFSDRAFDEGARAFFIRGQMGDATPEAAEMHRYCDPALPDLKAVKAPVYTYYGESDPLVVPANGAFWRRAVGGPATTRAYPGEGHDVQYRHWDQVLIDMAGFGSRELVCEGASARLLPAAAARRAVAAGATPGLCLWGKAK